MRPAVFEWAGADALDPVDLTGAVLVGRGDPDEDESWIVVEKAGKRYTLMNAESFDPNVIDLAEDI
jgi:hypothetical protein